MFHILWDQADLGAIQNAVMATFFDIYEDVSSLCVELVFKTCVDHPTPTVLPFFHFPTLCTSSVSPLNAHRLLSVTIFLSRCCAASPWHEYQRVRCATESDIPLLRISAVLKKLRPIAEENKYISQSTQEHLFSLMHKSGLCKALTSTTWFKFMLFHSCSEVIFQNWTQDRTMRCSIQGNAV